MASAALTPAHLVARIREITGASSDEALAAELNVRLRTLSRWKANDKPDWDNTLMLLAKAGYLAVDKTETTRAQIQRAKELAGRLQAVARDLEQLLGDPESPPAS